MRMAIARQAEKLARKNKTSSHFRLGAVISQGARVFSRGTNQTKPKGIIPCSVHAEEAALRRLPILDGGDIYVARVLADDSLAISRPCDNCMKLIREKHLDTIHFIDKNGFWRSEELIY